ncbi:GH3 auxin-responsive promoter family protein [Almyronema epifaneia]|uniref:GH3 auxin-responsive promoter family protein n=1 Tax=Almyronema epifaneia S1 TaxID=2991925 RepID=A0ABW6IC33_9CYAN
MGTPLLKLVATLARWQARSFVAKLPRSTTIQANFLKSLLQVQQATVLGQELKLAHITTLDQFRQTVPIWPYSAYHPYFERAAAGEQNVVAPEPLLHINLSSGSTGNQKLIPITRRSQQNRAYANQVAMGFAFTQAQQRGLNLGKMLLTHSAQSLGQTSGGIPYGHVSSNQLRSTPGWLYQQLFAQPRTAQLISDTLARHYVCLLFALSDANLAVIGATFPLVALQLCTYLETYGASLIEDLASGEIADWIKLEPEFRASLAQQLRPQRDRARQLAQLLKTAGRLLPQQVWPHLAFMVTARGGPSSFYFERFDEYFGDLPIFGGTFAASEAVFGSHWNFNTDGTLLAIASNFFEFVAPDQWTATYPQTLLPHEVKIGEFYRILVTNYSGFYRYDIGDVVEVTGMRAGVPLIAFRYRQGGTLSAISEKTTEYHAVQVLTVLKQHHALAIEDFCITLSENWVDPYYVLNLELTPNAPVPPLPAVLADFDRQLQAANQSYALKRQKNDILPPRLNLLDSGSFATLRQHRLKPGTPDTAQVKLPHISSDRTLLAEVKIQQQVSFSSQSPIGRSSL